MRRTSTAPRRAASLPGSDAHVSPPQRRTSCWVEPELVEAARDHEVDQVVHRGTRRSRNPGARKSNRRSGPGARAACSRGGSSRAASRAGRARACAPPQRDARARWIRFDIEPEAIVPASPIEHGADHVGVPPSRRPARRTARASRARRRSVDRVPHRLRQPRQRLISGEPGVAVQLRSRSTSIPDARGQTPISHPEAASASSSRAAYRAPEAPDIPRKTRTTRYFPPLEGFEEDGELWRLSSPRAANGGIGDPGLTQLGHLRWRSGTGCPCPSRPRGEIGRAEVRRARAEVGVAVVAARLGEELRPGERLRCSAKPCFCAQLGIAAFDLASDRLLRGRALVGEHAHRDDDEDRGDDRDRPREQRRSRRTSTNGSASSRISRSSGSRPCRGSPTPAT
jgi:hypothetical protein